METNAWNQLRALFEKASALEGDARAAFLDQVRASNATLCVELETLLAAAQAPEEGTGARPAVDAPVSARLFELRSAGNLQPPKTTGPAPVFKPQWAGRYLLLRRLGRGGMAEVFLARSHGPGGFERLVAVKRFVADYFGEEELKKRFEREAKVSALLTHPNIVHVYDFEESQGTYLLAMEYVKGRDLASILGTDGKQGLPVVAAVHVAMQVAEALEYAYTREIEGTDKRLEVVHRDLSPRNIMIGFDGSTKLVDFGIARARGRTALTEVGAIRGTLAYLAPEVASGSIPDHRSDLFSLFVVLYEAIAGTTLFDATNFADLLDQIATCSLPQPKVSSLDVDDALKALLLRGLAKDPAKRFATAGEVVKALDGYLRSLTQEPPKQLLQRALQEYFSEARRDEDRANTAALELAKDVPPIALANPGRSGASEPSAPRRLPPGFPLPPDPGRPVAFPTPQERNERPDRNDRAERKAPLPPMPEPQWQRSADPSRYQSTGSRWALPLLVGATVAIGAYFWKERPSRSIADAPPAAAQLPASTAECLLSLETEPPGARVGLSTEPDGHARTPTTLTVPCGSTVVATLRLEGYEFERVTVTAVNEFQVIRRKLKGTQPGHIELVLSHDATVLLNGEALAEVGAGQPFELKVAGGEGYVFRFQNEKLGIDYVDRIFVAPGGRTRKTVNLVPR